MGATAGDSEAWGHVQPTTPIPIAGAIAAKMAHARTPAEYRGRDGTGGPRRSTCAVPLQSGGGSRRVSGMRRLAIAALGCSAAASACRAGGGPEPWIGERAAVVQCVTAGPHRMPPMLTGWPTPAPPAGLYARAMDPAALDELGFGRDEVVCAVLEPPASEVLATLEAQLEALVRTRADASRSAMLAGGACTCDAADALGLRSLLRVCLETPTVARCEQENMQGPVGAALAPLIEALGQTARPLLHWRLVGRTDSPGWFARQHTKLLSRYENGSTVYVSGQAIPRRHNHELVRRLLAMDDVTAVAVQNSGQALVVFRELGGRLVIDRFEYPAFDRANVPMLALWDNARVDETLRLLAPPTATRKLELPPDRGNLVEVDRAGLSAIDALLTAVAPLGMGVTPPADTSPEPKVERVTLQAPFGHDGRVLRARVRLSPAGRTWAATLTDTRLSPTLEELGLPDVTPVASDDEATSLVYAGTPLQSQLFHGLENFAWVFKRIEMEHPGTVSGVATQWRYKLPQTDLAEVFPGPLPFPGMRAQLATRPYGLEGSFDATREVLQLELAPR